MSKTKEKKPRATSLRRVTMADRHIGRCLRLQRINLGMSQEALGDHLGLTFQQIQKYERGLNRVSAARLYTLARVLHVDVSFFYEGMPQDTKIKKASGVGLEEAVLPEEYMEFVSSHEGLTLNKSFVRLRNKDVRQRMIEMVCAVDASQPKKRQKRRKS